MKNATVAKFFFLIATLHFNISYAYEAWVTDTFSTSLSIIDTDTNMLLHTMNLPEYSNSIAFSPDGTRAYVTLLNEVAVIDTTSRMVIATIQGIGSPLGIATVSTSNGFEVFVCNYQGGNIIVIDGKSNLITHTIPVTGNPVAIAITPNGKKGFIASRNNNGKVNVIDTSSYLPSTDILLNADQPQSVGISPDGTTVCVGDSGSSLYFIDASSNQILGNINFNGNGVTQIAFLPGTTIGYSVDGGDEKAVQQFNWKEMTLLDSIPINAHTAGVAITPEGDKLYASASLDSGDNEVALVIPKTNTYSGTSITFGTDLFMIAIKPLLPSPPPSPPPAPPAPSFSLSLSGNRIKNNFGVVYEFVNALQWSISSNSNVALYRVYRDGVLIATLDSFNTRFEDHDRPKNTAFNYSVIAFDSNNNEISFSNEVRI